MTPAGKRAAAIAAVSVGPLVLVLVPALIMYQRVAYDLPPRLSDAARAAAVAPLRAVVDGGTPGRPEHAELARRLPGQGTVIVSLWSVGRRVARVEGHGAAAADAIADAARPLLGDTDGLRRLDAPARTLARLQVDVVAAHAPLIGYKSTRALGVVAGLDGVGVHVENKDVLLAAEELVELKLLDAVTPIPMVQEFKVGLEFDAADAQLAVRAALPAGHYGMAGRRYFRFRTDSFIERPAATRAAGAPLPLTRGLPPGPELTAENLRAAAVAGGTYLAEHLAANGRYYYEVQLGNGQSTDPTNLRGAYSLPRHCGTSYYLAQLYGETHDARLREALERAFEHLVSLIDKGGCKGTTPDGKPFVCVVDAGQKKTNMGSTALAVVALAQYRLATNDPRYDAELTGMIEWILWLQKPNGGFAHMYDVPSATPDWKTEMLYFDGEAALALVRGYKIFKDPRMIRGAERALDKLMGFYDFFAGQFFFGEEHWTCIAAEAAWPDLKKDRYREFCSDYAAFLRGQQFEDGEVPTQEDLVGAYSVTPFFVPHNTPVGSRSEAMISAYLLTKHHGRPDERIRRQVLAAMRYLLRQQIRPESDYFTPARAALGGMPSSTVDKTVRIDYVQHTCSAMLRSIELLEAGDE